MADPADINVDDLRRRARRRLVGAIVLALAAAVIVPMLLESEPKPLGESVAVRIPPIDDGKFVNRLNDGAAKSDGPKDIRKDAPLESAPRKSVADAEKSVVAPAGKPPRYDTQIATDAPAAAESATPAKSAATATNSEAAKAETSPKSAAKAETFPQPAAKAESGAREGFAVQLAAFSDDKGANSLANRLTRGGYPAYTEPLKTSRGTLWRVRVGPFPSREAANVVRDKLKTEGQNGIVASNH